MSLPQRITSAIVFVLISSVVVEGQGPPDRRGGGRRVSPLQSALDLDENGAISAEEIAAAATSLLAVDKNADGNLTFDELTPPGRGRRGRRGGPGGPGMRSRMDPIISALDKDEDGELFEDEVTDAALSLRSLDRDGDGVLSGEELRPDFSRFGRGPGGGRGGRDGGGGEGGSRILPEELKPEDGRPTVPDLATFQELSYQGKEVLVDTHLAGLEFVKFQIEEAGSDDPDLYFMNTNTHRSHPAFMRFIGVSMRGGDRMRGVLIRWPHLKSPSGELGLYTFEFEPNDTYSYEKIRLAFDMLEKHSPLLKGNLSYNLLTRAKEVYVTEKEKYDEGKLPVFEVAERYDTIAFLPLHEGESFGRLRSMAGSERPGPRDIVLYPTLPNEMPRVAGVITAVRQTPLSHVNLRAVQDDVPNAYIAGAMENAKIAALVGKYVSYRVTSEGYELREATADEVTAHFASMRPKVAQVPPRDLSVREIRPFDEIDFAAAKSVGVKAANLAALHQLSLDQVDTPDGFAIPFVFYVEFMKHNDFDAMAKRMMENRDFQRNADTRQKSLEQFQKAIKKGKMPRWMHDALSAVQARFPKGSSIRCRSSTNNEDLPNFSGAGLYDSYTHHPDEGHLSKSVKQVFASLWNFRAFEEREFHRIDHGSAAMGVVLHLNTKEEQANGVAVTKDILYGTEAQVGPRFYINAQTGEDLVTNPKPGSSPEELLISPRNPRTDQTIRRSSQVPAGETILSADHLLHLRRALRAIDGQFRKLYAPSDDQPFAMEVEFKVTKEGKLFIKQARPWVFAGEDASPAKPVGERL